MRKLLLIALLLPVTLSAADRKPLTLTGTVVADSTRSAVGYATVSLQRKRTPLAAVAADAAGRFAIVAPEAGEYDLCISMVGYTPYSRPVEVPAEGRELGEVAIRQGVDVGDVVIEVQKPLVMSDAEKTTYSVEDDPQATTSTLDEIIRKIPQLSLDGEGNVLLNGQSNYKILLDGRNSATMSNNFKEVIQSMPASQISRIEVITNPSTKYEAEGVGGIINLITQRKKQFHGYNGSIGGRATVLENASYGGNASFALQAGKFAASIMGNFSYHDGGRTPSESESWQENIGSDSRFNRTTSENTWSGRFGNVGLDLSYQPDTLNLVTMSGWLWTGHNRNKALSETAVLDPAENPLAQYTNHGSNVWEYTGGSVAVNYEHTFNRQGHTLTLSDEVEIDPDNGLSDQVYEGAYAYRTLQDDDNRTTGNTVQIDYANRLSDHHNIEAGLKHIYRNSDSKSDIRRSNAEGEFPDAAARLTDMAYRQHVLGIYAGYGVTFTKWSGRLGGRIERTWNDADVSETGKEAYSFSNRLFNVIPYASLTFIPKVSHNLSLSYTQRLQRPGIWMLSPALDDTDPLQRTYGNPDLEAAVYHTLNLRYGHYAAKWSMTLSANTFLSNNNMSSYSFVDEQGVTHTTYSNDVHSRSYGVNGSFSVRPSDKFNLSVSFNGGYSTNDFDAMDIHTGRFNFSQNLNLDMALWKQGRLMLGESYATGYASLGRKSDSFYYYYVGLKQQFLKKKLDVSITCSNPFEKYSRQTSTFDTPTFIGRSRYRYASRSLSFRISYRFGKQNVGVKRTARSISNDDMSGGSKGGAGDGGGGAR